MKISKGLILLSLASFVFTLLASTNISLYKNIINCTTSDITFWFHVSIMIGVNIGALSFLCALGFALYGRDDYK